MKKRIKILLLIIPVLLVLTIIYGYKTNTKEYIFKKTMRNEYYSYLPKEAKEYIQDIYEETGEIVKTEKNQEENTPYLNPDFVNYLTMSEKERAKIDIIPQAFSINYDYTKVESPAVTEESYDLRNVNNGNYITPLKDQGNLGICWTIAASEQIESYLMLKNNTPYNSNSLVLSPRQIDYATSKNGIKDYTNTHGFRNLTEGGNFFMSSEIMSYGLSTVSENYMPYNESTAEKEVAEVLNFNNSNYEVNQAVDLPTIYNRLQLDYSSEISACNNLSTTEETNQCIENYENELKSSYMSAIKNGIKEYGGAVVETMPPGGKCSFKNTDGKYVVATNSSCWDANEGHAMQVIGWDDNYSYTYCKGSTNNTAVVNNRCTSGEKTEGTGAFLIRNSWGDNAYSYIYLTYDTINSTSTSSQFHFVTDVTPTSERDWDNIYTKNIDYLRNFSLSTQVTQTFEKNINSNEILKKIKFNTLTADGSYNITITDGTKTYSYNSIITTTYPGLYVIDLSDKNIVITSNKFTVKITANTARKYLISNSISAFTENTDESPIIENTSSTSITTNNTTSISQRFLYKTKNISSGETVNFSLTKDTGEDFSTYLTVQNNIVAENNLNPKIIVNTLPVGNYNLKASYNNVETITPIVVQGDEITILYKANDGTDNFVQEKVLKNSTITLKENQFTRTGYIFKNWSTRSNGNGTNYNDKATVTNGFSENTLLYAIWEPITYNLVLHANNGTEESTTQNLTYDEESTIEKNTFTKTGYTFKEWNTEANGEGTTYTDEEVINNLTTTNNDSIDLYAIWIPINYKLKLYANNGTEDYDAQNLIYNEESIINKNNFTKTGYNFKEWNTDQNGEGTSYTDEQSIINLTTTNDETIRLYAIWEPITYNLVLHANNGTEDFTNQTITYDEETTIEKNTFTKTGYNFKEWNTNSNGEGTSYTDEQVINNLTTTNNATIDLYAIWTPINYKLRLYANNGTNNFTAQDLTYDVETTIPKNTFFRTGYTFKEWNTKANGKGTVYTDEQAIINLGTTNNEIVRLFAIWEPNTYTVVLNANNGTEDSTSLELTFDVETALPKNTFTKAGYTFKEWNTNKNGERKSYADEEVVKNITSTNNTIVNLYAIWEPITYNLVLHANNGTDEFTTQSLTYNEEATIEKNTFTKTGYTFKEWNTNATGEGTSYTDEQVINNLTTTNNSTIDLYAIWTPINYKLKLYANNGTEDYDVQNLTYDEDSTINKNNFTKIGYTFKEWNTDQNGEGTAYTDEQAIINLTTNSDETIRLFAIWEPITYNLVLHANNGTDDFTTQSLTYNEETTIEKNTFTKTGYTFKEWNTNATGEGTSYTDEQVINNLTTTNNDTIDLYAIWTPINYKLRLYANNGTNNFTVQDLTYDVETTLPKNTFFRTGYTFKEWNTKGNGTGTVYTDEQAIINLSTTNNETVRLFAIWEPITYTVVLNANNGTEDSTSLELTFDVETALPKNTFTKAGYTFKEWNTNKNGERKSYADEEVVKNITSTNNATVNLYAIWEPISYNLVLHANNGTEDIITQNLTYDEESTIEKNTFTKAGYTFKEWNTNPNGEGTSFTDEQEINNLTTTNEGIVDLYAIWTPINYSVNFKDTESQSQVYNQQLTYDKAEHLRKNTFTKTGYLFEKWITNDPEDERIFTDEQEVLNLTTNSDEQINLIATWIPIYYELKLFANNGTSEFTNQALTYDIETTIEKNTFTKIGYTFKEWNTSPNGKGTSYTDEQVIKNLTTTNGERINLYAIWEPINYKLKLYANNGTEDYINQNLTYDEQATILKNNYSKEGYIFKEWNTSPNGDGTSYTDEQTIINLTTTNNDTIRLFAIWIPINYELKLYANNGTSEFTNQALTYDIETTILKNYFIKTGYSFKEWNTKQNGEGTSYTDEQIIKNLTTTNGERINLYAIWKPVNYNLVLHANNGTDDSTTQELTYDKDAIIKANSFTRVGYTFKEWNTESNGTGIVIHEGDTIKNLSTTENSTVNVYAIWTPINYSVNFKDKESQSSVYNQQLTYDKAEHLLKNTFTKTGYLFDKWIIDDSEDDRTFTDEEEVINLTTNSDEQINLTATWIPITYQLKLHANNGTSDFTSQTLTYDTEATIEKNTFTKTGYTFKEWNTNPNGEGTSYNDEAEILNLTTTANEEINLYAIWIPKQYEVVFDGNGATGNMNNQIITYDENAILTKNEYTRNGYEFLEWNTKENGKGTAYLDEANVINLTSEDSITLYARWKKTVPNNLSILYSTHVQSYGWQDYKADGEMAGTSGEAKRLEAIKIKLSDNDFSKYVLYRTHIQSYGWEKEFKNNNNISGTSGEGKRLEAIEIKLDGDLAELYDVYYRVHAQTFGWLGWAKNGEAAGTEGYAKRLEGIEIKLVPKDQEFPTYGEKEAFKRKYIEYQTHVQSYGWQDFVADGEMSGTSGEAKRLEGIKILLNNPPYSGSVLYRTHVQSYDWQDYVADGEMSGTSGEAKRLEAIQILLTGEMANKYDIYYRVHAQSFGWLAWAKNGESAGTEGLAKRLEGIEIVLVEKGGTPPVRDNQNNDKSFVKG